MRLILLVMLISVMVTVPHAQAFPNPAAVYCEEEGYGVEKVSTPNGEMSFCVLPDKKCELWEFYRGGCGSSFGMSFEVVTSRYKAAYEKLLKADESVNTRNVTDGSSFVFESNTRSTLFGDTFSGSANGVNATELNMGNASFMEFDWRNVSGSSWMTPVKDQGSCGSCWAFASLGILESKFKINLNSPSFDPDLSEQDLISCITPWDCKGGLIDSTFEAIQYTGILEESCFPYLEDDIIGCDVCPDWDDSIHSITNWTVLTPESALTQLENEGPITFGFEVFSDFDDYNGGVYKNTTDTIVGTHAMVLTGYNASGGYWIVKNSWGTGWGDNGYVKIDFDVSLFAYYGGSEASVSVIGTDWKKKKKEDRMDNCRFIYNPDQLDGDGDCTGDVCDANATEYDASLPDLDNNGIADICDCMPLWIEDAATCATDNSITKRYVDKHSCNKTYDLPSDNGTVDECDYCKENLTMHMQSAWSECINGTQEQKTVYVDNSFDSCCNVTGLDSDCSILNDSLRKVTEVRNCTPSIPVPEPGPGIIRGNISGYDVIVNGSVFSPEDAERLVNVTISSGNETVLEFMFNFSESFLDLTGVVIERSMDNDSLSWISVSGLVLQGNLTKTVYMPGESGTGVCIRDDETVNMSLMTDTCTGANETWVACPGNVSGYACDIVGNDTRFMVSGLLHSGVKEQPEYCGDSMCSSSEGCSTCPDDCGTCPPPDEPEEKKSGGGSGYIVYTAPCEPEWICTGWKGCEDGLSQRLCRDSNECGTGEGKPASIQECEMPKPEPVKFTGEPAEVIYISDEVDTADLPSAGMITGDASGLIAVISFLLVAGGLAYWRFGRRR